MLELTVPCWSLAVVHGGWIEKSGDWAEVRLTPAAVVINEDARTMDMARMVREVILIVATPAHYLIAVNRSSYVFALLVQ